MRYYIICENTNRILAIHKVADSACACFQRMAKSEDVPRFLSLVCIETDNSGITQHEYNLLTYSKSSGALIDHTIKPAHEGLTIKVPSRP